MLREAVDWLEHCAAIVRRLLVFVFLTASLLAGLSIALPSSAHAQFSLDKSVSAGRCSKVGDVIDYAYLVANNTSAQVTNLSLSDDKIPEADINCPANSIGKNKSITCTGRYTVTADDIQAGGVTNTATAVGRQRPTTIVTADDRATVTCSSPVEPTEDVQEVEKKEEAFDKRFINHSLRQMLDDEPDRPRFIRRFPGSLWGGNGGTGTTNSSPFNLAMSGADGKASFSTSLSQMASAMAGADQAKQQQAMSLGSATLNERPGPAPYSGVDIWTEAHFTAFNDDIGNGNADGDFDILYVGADIPLTTNLLVGILGQFDWANEHTKLDGSSAEGNGWMVGPYLSARLDEHLFFDWRAAWGQSDNKVSPFGTYTDNFDTDRWLTTARLTGNWTSGNWRLTPSAAFKYGEEEQQAYTDSNGIRIAGQTDSLGRIEFGPEFGYRWDLADGTLIEPQLSLVGVWNFEEGGSFLVGNTFVTPDDFTGRVEGGVLVQLPKGMSFRSTAAYDGIGSSDYEAWTGKVWLNLPLN